MTITRHHPHARDLLRRYRKGWLGDRPLGFRHMVDRLQIEAKLTLEIGVTYLARCGRRVKITCDSGDPRYPFWSDQGYPYPANGKYFGFPDRSTWMDLVAVAPPIDEAE